MSADTVQQRICAAALDLFEHNGYADTDIDTIAQHAGTSRRTFFRHFNGKDDAILRHHRQHLDRFNQTLQSNGRSTDPSAAFDQIVAAATDALRDVWQRPELSKRRYNVVFTTPELHQRMRATDLDYELAIVAHLTSSLGERRAHLIAAAGLAAVNHALHQLSQDVPAIQARLELDESLTDVASTITGWLAQPAATTVVVTTIRATPTQIHKALAQLDTTSHDNQDAQHA